MTVLQTEKSKLIKVGGYQSHDTGKSSTYVQLANDGQVTFLVAAGTLAQTLTVFAYQSTTSSGGAAMAAHYQKATLGTIDLSEPARLTTGPLPSSGTNPECPQGSR